MTGWDRRSYWDDLGLVFVMPSPNIPVAESTVTFPGFVYFEGTDVSEGRGTTRPLEQCAAPYIRPDELIAHLDAESPGWHDGAYVRATGFLPTFQKHAGKVCLGVFVHPVRPGGLQPRAHRALAAARHRHPPPGRLPLEAAALRIRDGEAAHRRHRRRAVGARLGGGPARLGGPRWRRSAPTRTPLPATGRSSSSIDGNFLPRRASNAWEVVHAFKDLDPDGRAGGRGARRRRRRGARRRRRCLVPRGAGLERRPRAALRGARGVVARGGAGQGGRASQRRHPGQGLGPRRGPPARPRDRHRRAPRRRRGPSPRRCGWRPTAACA